MVGNRVLILAVLVLSSGCTDTSTPTEVVDGNVDASPISVDGQAVDATPAVDARPPVDTAPMDADYNPPDDGRCDYEVLTGPELGDAFGFDVAINGPAPGYEVVVIGAPNARSGAGMAYFVECVDGEWTAPAALPLPDDPCISELRGLGQAVTVSTDGRNIMVGAPGTAVFPWDEDAQACDTTATPADESGVVVSYYSSLDADGGFKLGHVEGTAGGQTSGRRFGNDVDIDLSRPGITFLYGAPGESRAYVTRLSGNTLRQVEIRPTVGDEASFGASVAEVGDTFVIGAPDDGNGTVWVATDTGEDTIIAEPVGFASQAGERLGASVALAAGMIVAGAPSEGAADGRIRIATGPDWTRKFTVTKTSDGFGTAIALDPDLNLALIGAPGVGGVVFVTSMLALVTGTMTGYVQLRPRPAINYGTSVATTHGLAVTGAPSTDDPTVPGKVAIRTINLDHAHD